MTDSERATTIVFNGMIYNYRELREGLIRAGVTFHSNCDTEVVLKAYGRYGSACVRHLRGMFAFAIWDAQRERLLLARDRLGVKPLYYSRQAKSIHFASQVRALLASRQVPFTLSHAGVASYLAFGGVSEPLTAVDGIHAVPAGHTATFEKGAFRLEPYWDPASPSLEAPQRPEPESLRYLLETTVGQYLLSDAPLGVFLSGGLDSSALAALAQRSSADVRTVSVSFAEKEFAEGAFSDLVADHLGTRHKAILLGPADLLNSLDGAFGAMDQPTFDGINTYVVSNAAVQEGLKVALSGLGADELFDGYGYGRRVRKMERFRRVAATAFGGILAGGTPARLKRGRAEKLDAWLHGDIEPGRSYELLRRLFLPGEIKALTPAGLDCPASVRPAPVDRSADLARQVCRLDLTHYTRNVLLRDTDCMSMANSLEVRVPYLDHEVVEWALSLPSGSKDRNKRVLATAVRDLLPAQIRNRRKQGFAFPFARWMGGPLREEIDEALRAPSESAAGLIDADGSWKVWQAYLHGSKRWLPAWALYALTRWCRSVEDQLA